jgi:hypothetical protein
VKFRRRNVEALGDLVVGNIGGDDAQNEDEARYFPYRSSGYIQALAVPRLGVHWVRTTMKRRLTLEDVERRFHRSAAVFGNY